MVAAKVDETINSGGTLHQRRSMSLTGVVDAPSRSGNRTALEAAAARVQSGTQEGEQPDTDRWM
jgi:hypothetical protein